MAKSIRYGDKQERKHMLRNGVKYDAANLPMLQNLAALGFSATDLGIVMGHTGDARQFIKNLQRREPEVLKALQTGREMANINLVAQAYKAACGYEYEEKTVEYDCTGAIRSTKITKKFQKPEPNLAMFLMCNRMGDEFKSVHKIEVNRTDTSAHLDVSVTQDQIAALGGRLLELAEDRKAKSIKCEVIDETTTNYTRSILRANTEDDTGEHSIQAGPTHDSDPG